MTEQETRRVVLLLTEDEPLSHVWEAAQALAGETDEELVVLFVVDDRWHRAARLPYTMEVSTIGGEVRDFSVQRADQVIEEAADKARQRLDRLAARANRRLLFEILSTPDRELIQRLIGDVQSTLVASRRLLHHPIHSVFKNLQYEILLVDSQDGGNDEAQDREPHNDANGSEAVP
ncbi:MAG: hypothetical protein QNJ40_05960 [Xanthomonadales bacterium]|nr:hypothetical protein [Xanthomonadales bacterium]